ncbi:cupin domain-containing protein [Thiotrichales bacterium 19S3-7]|nr:cupin domain-containing protein [Thiotrichales bacterium 19S3-7]MCF6802816.1 cupin domain-containing protein [Thiotrichales bacterium 19S3-11]
MTEIKARRVILGQNNLNQSDILEDNLLGASDHYLEIDEHNKGISINLWSTKEAPANLHDLSGKNTNIDFLPETNGSVFRLCSILPDQTLYHHLDTLHLNSSPLTDEQKNDKHPLMHQVDSLVYGIVLQGKIHIILDNNETELKPGDCVIDMGSKHAWSNKTNQTALMAFILLDARR